MDPLAHTLVGAALARTRIARGVPLATTTLVAAANLPDVDVLSYLAGEDAALGFRRGLTHGPLGIVLLPLALLGVLALASRRRRARGGPLPLGRLAALAYLGALTHPLLDLLNVYGVRILSPFSQRWFYGDVLFIVDPWFWLVLGAGAFLVREPTRPALVAWALVAAAATWLMLGRPTPLWSRWLWSSALAATALARPLARDRLRAAREPIATAALALWLAYLAGMIGAGELARRRVETGLAELGVAPVESSMVAPVPVDPLARDVVVELPDGYRFGRFRLATGELRLEEGLEPKPPDAPAVRAALADPSVEGFLRWARFPFVRIEPTEGGATRVHLLDARYAREVPASGRRFGTATVEVPGAQVAPKARGEPAGSPQEIP